MLIANDNSERPITVIDSLMGLGKTTYILTKLREEASNVSSFTGRPSQKVIVLVPLLSEIERYQRALPAFAFKEPSERDPKRLRKRAMGRSSMTSSGWSRMGRTSSPPTPSFTRWTGNCTPSSKRLATN